MAVFNKEVGRVDNCQSILLAAERGEIRIVTSALTLTEVIKIKGKATLAADSEDTIRAFFEHEWIVVRDVDRFIAEQARDFIWKYKLQPYDAIHLATAYKMKLQHLDTYDRTDLGKLDGKLGVPEMKIGKPPRIPYQTNLPGIQPTVQTSKRTKTAKPEVAVPKKKRRKVTSEKTLEDDAGSK